MVEAAGVELLRHLKTRKLLMTKQQEGPKAQNAKSVVRLLYEGKLTRGVFCLDHRALIRQFDRDD